MKFFIPAGNEQTLFLFGVCFLISSFGYGAIKD